MVFPDDESILGLGTLTGDAWPHYLGQSVDIDGIDVEPALDLGPERFGPWFGAEDPDSDRSLPSVEALPGKLRCKRQDVAGCQHNDSGLQIRDHLNLFLGLPSGHRNDGAPEPFSPVVRTQAAGKQSV